jgi:hypothetical protein
VSIAILRIIGISLYLYLVWRNMKEEYNGDKMVSFAWQSLFCFFILGRIFFGIVNWGVFNNYWADWLSIWSLPGFSYFGGFLGIFLFAWGYSKKRELRFHSFLESLTPNFLWLMLFLLADNLLVEGYGTWLFIKFLLVLLMIFLSRIFRLKYRSWVFYKSGKKGFVFLAVASLFFLVLGLLSFVFPVSLVYRLSYLFCSLLFVVQLVILGEICQRK